MLDGAELDVWISENGTGHRERRFINGITYLFTELKDGWYAIWKCEDGHYFPRIEAKNVEKCVAWCSMYEQSPVPLNVF